MNNSEIKTPLWQKQAYGMPVWLLVCLLAVIYTTIFLGLLPSDNMLTVITVMFSIGLVLYQFGEWLPIWKDYIGGGAVMAFFGAAALEYYNILPAEYSEAITFFYDDYGFQTLFISLLIVSAVLTVDRKQLIYAFGGYVPAILGGIFAAAVFGCIGALIVGIDLKETINYFVLPIMGGGNGAGALPLSEMWQEVTGQSKEEYYSMAFAILNIANNFAILGAVALNSLGNKYPKLSGNGELIRSANGFTGEDKEKINPTLVDIAGGLLLTCALFAISRTFSKHILPSIGVVILHMYAYMVVFTGILNVLDVVPRNIVAGAQKLSNFFTKPLMCMCMCGIGIAFTDLGDFLSAINVPTLVVCFFVVLGAIIGSGFVGTLVGFNFVESAMTAGLCMANRGGSGDLQVLGAGKRMNLMSFAQISSRIGGAIILILASIVFGFLGNM